MKDRIYLFVNFSSDEWARAQLFLRSLGRPDLAVEPQQEFGYRLQIRTEADLQEAQALLESLELLQGVVRRDRLYTRQEIVASPLLHLMVTRAPRGHGGPYHGTRYDLSRACPVCGTGAQQISPLVISPRALPERAEIMQTLDSEILVSARVGGILTEARIAGLELRAAVSANDGSELPWLQIIASTTLPPMSPATCGLVRENPCGYCQRDGYFGTSEFAEEIMYGRGVVADRLPEVLRTYEHFGNSRLADVFSESHFASALLIIKPRVWGVLGDMRVRGIAVTPVTIEVSGGSVEGPAA